MTLEALISEAESILNGGPTVEPQRSEQRINYALAHYRNRNPVYKGFIEYYEGIHNLRFATEKWKNAFGAIFRKFADNLCPAIVDAAADRMQIIGFQVPESPDIGKALWNMWTNTRMDRKAGSVHEHAFKAGDAYVIVWPDANGQPQISPNPAHQICPYYNDEGQLEWAIKLWSTEDGHWRLNIYTSESIEKYITIAGGKAAMPTKATNFRRFTQFSEPWPVPNPFGAINVFHFANNAEMGVWGESELVNVIPLQDALNKSVLDMLVAMEFVALPQRYATGLEIDTKIDPNTGQEVQVVPFKAGVDRIWASGDPETRFGQFEPADITRFTKVQNDFRLEMARISRTPLHYLGMGSGAESAFVASMYPSGESLKTAEAPFAAKIRDRQTSYGDVWEDVVRFAARIAGTELPEGLETIWVPPTPRSITEDLDNAKKRLDIGIPQLQVWEELGYTHEQIQAMLTMEQTPAEKLAVAAATPVQRPNSSSSTTKTNSNS